MKLYKSFSKFNLTIEKLQVFPIKYFRLIEFNQISPETSKVTQENLFSYIKIKLLTILLFIKSLLKRSTYLSLKNFKFFQPKSEVLQSTQALSAVYSKEPIHSDQQQQH